LVRILGRRGYQNAQRTNPMEMGESVPDFDCTLVARKYLLHEYVEKVLLCGVGTVATRSHRLPDQRHLAHLPNTVDFNYIKVDS